MLCMCACRRGMIVYGGEGLFRDNIGDDRPPGKRSGRVSEGEGGSKGSCLTILAQGPLDARGKGDTSDRRKLGGTIRYLGGREWEAGHDD